jgi:ABC-type oligopeptide transport system substrate-binding subunit
MEWRAYLEKHNKKEMPFFHMRWGADYLDAENFLSTLLASYGPENKVNYVNPEYDALCAKADTTADPAERLKLYAQAQDIVLQDAPFIPIYFQRDAELISPRVKGLRESLFGHLPHTTVSME